MKLKFLPIKKILVFGTLAFSIQAASAQANVFDNIIATSPTHTSLEAALIKAGLDDDLKTGTNLTVFAPDDAAFSAAAVALNTDINGLLALPNLKDILLYHVLGSKVLSTAVTNGLVANPLSPTNTLKFTKTSDGKIFVNQAQVTTADINATNGVVHVINSVVLPAKTVVDVALGNKGFTTLTKALIKEELLPVLTNPFTKFTVFAPDDDAFEAAATALSTDINGLLALPNLKDILLYHVSKPSIIVTSGTLFDRVGISLTGLNVNGTSSMILSKSRDGRLFVNQAQVTAPDLNTYNGNVHVINSVLLPVSTVYQAGVSGNNFSFFTLSVIQQDLIPMLTNPYLKLTVFKPSNEAFIATATESSKNINTLIGSQAILLYHVLGSKITSSQLINGQVVTLSGEELTVNTTNGVKIENTTVTTADILASNGVVHIVDKVLLPPTVSGISDKKVTTFALYPNPAVDLISTDNYLGYVYQIYNTQGSLQEAGIAKETINISQLPTGSYIIKLSNEGTTVSSKFNKN